MPKKIRELKRMLRKAGMSCHYSMIIQWSDEDQVFVVSLPEFGPYSKTHGGTYEEAAKHGQEVLELLIETYHAEGWALPEPTKVGAPVTALGAEAK